MIPQIASNAFVYSIRSTASLFEWFACETGLINKVTFKNNFNAGTIKFNQEILQSGDSKSLFNGDSHVLTALPQSYHNYNYIWNVSAPNARSSWSKLDKDGNPYTISNNLNIAYNLNVTSQDIDATYTAGLRKNFKLTVNHQTEFDGTQANQATVYIVEQNTGQISAPATKSVSGKDYRFAYWEDLNKSTTKTIKPTDNTTYTAYYKAHLLSSTSSATTSNNQRKIVQSENGKWAMVYESSNQIWLSTSTDGSSWGNEILISNTENSSSPSIIMTYDKIYVVWQQMYWAGGTGFDNLIIWGRKYDLSTGILDEKEQIANFQPSSQSFNATQVVDGGFGVSGTDLMVVWRQPDGLYTRDFHTVHGDWQTVSKISGTNSYSRNPSIANISGLDYLICWVDENYGSLNYTEKYYDFPSINVVEQVSPSNWDNTVRPQIVLGYGSKPTIVWTSRNNVVEGGPSVHVRQRSNTYPTGSWGTITSFSHPNSSATLSPVIGNISGSNSLYVFWNIGNNVYKASASGTTWSGLSLVTTSGGNGINLNMHASNEIKAIWQKSDNSIGFYSVINQASKTVAGENERSNLDYRLNRHAMFDLSDALNDSTISGTVAFELAGVKKSYGSATSDVDVEYSDDNTLTTSSFPVDQPNMKLSFRGAVYGYGKDISNENVSRLATNLFNVNIVDKNTDQVLSTIWSSSDNIKNSVINKTFGEFKEMKVNLNSFLGKEVYVSFELGNKELTPVIDNDYLILSDSVSLNKTQQEVSKIELPNDYKLLQNYPNPFNPSTTIAFYIPQASYVKLSVYNSLSQLVKTVVSERLEKGYHSFNLDMGQLSSGVYFYKMTSGNFTSTKKLLLLK